MIIEGLKEYFSSLLDEGEVRNSFLSENVPDYAIFSEDGETVLKKYVSGDVLCQFVFSFRARLPYSKKDEETRKISIFFESLADRVKENSDKNQFPDLGEGKKIQTIEAVSDGKIRNTNVSDCVYEMKFKTTYYKRR